MNQHLWFPLTLVCALALATSDAFTKKGIEHHNEYLVMWLRLLYTMPVLLFLRLLSPAGEMNAEFLSATLPSLPLEAIAFILYLKALKLSPLSLTLPFQALTPVFLLIIPYLLLGEKISATGGAGIMLIALGSYALNLRALREGGFLAPIRAIFTDRGSLCMVCVAFIYSITSTLGKKGITATSPFYFASFYVPLLTIILTPIVFWKARHDLKGCLRSGVLKSALIPGIFSSLELVTHMVAMNMTKVGYMIAVKRLSLLIGVLYGRLLFNEKHIGERTAGALLMIAGVALIVTGG